MANARETAVRALLKVFDGGGFSQLVLDSQMKKDGLTPEDRAFCSALFYGTVERRITLDWVLEQYSRDKVRELTPAVREILRLSLYQLIFLPSVPESAVVDEAVKLCRVFHMEVATGFVNGVLRTFIRASGAFQMPKHSVHALSVQYSVPEELISLWNTVYGKEKTLAILAGFHTPPPLFARVNTTRTTVEALLGRLAEEGAEASAAEVAGGIRLMQKGSPAALPAFREGFFHIQDLSGQKCAAALRAEPGMRVLDVCAAPGGKSFTLAEQMENKGELIACDLIPGRVSLIEEGARRLGLSILSARTQNGAEFAPELGEFDRILCDVPCSGYGVIRRKPEIRYKPLQSGKELPPLQLKILTNAARYLKKGGRLVYSTCTLNPQENQLVVKKFLAEHPGFEAEAPRTLFPERDGGDGFFYEALIRRD